MEPKISNLAKDLLDSLAGDIAGYASLMDTREEGLALIELVSKGLLSVSPCRNMAGEDDTSLTPTPAGFDRAETEERGWCVRTDTGDGRLTALATRAYSEGVELRKTYAKVQVGFYLSSDEEGDFQIVWAL